MRVNENNKIKIGIIMSVMAVIIWSGNFVISRALSDIVSPFTLSFWRWFLAVLFLFPIAYPHLKKEMSYVKMQWKLILGSGLTGVALYSVLIYYAGHSTTAGNMSLLASIGPIFTIIIMRVAYKERLTRRKIFGALIAFFGVILLVIRGDIGRLINFQFAYGDFIVIFDTFLWSIYSIMNKYRKPELSTESYLFSVFFIGLLIITPFYFIEVMISGSPVFNALTVGSYLYLAIGPSITAFFLWNRAILYIGPTKTAIIYNLIPVFSCIFAAILIKEQIMSIQIISMVIIVIGIITATANKLPFSKNT